MTFRNIFLLAVLIAVISGCGGGGTSGTTAGSASSISKTLVSLTISPANQRIALGTSQQYQAIGTYSDNTSADVSGSVSWNSSAGSVAGISTTAGSLGKASSIAAGATTISATFGNISDSTTLTVTAATLVSITVLPANPTLPLGLTHQFTATGTFSDNTTQDVTDSVTWNSSATSVASVSNAAGSLGKATSLGIGTTTVSATSGTVSGTTQLTCTAATVVPGSGGSTANVLAITVNGSLCSSGSYPNKPCVSVTVCSPDNSSCQTISDILLDTGSYGLRIFSQALSVPLRQVNSGSGSLAECVQYGDGSTQWGPVQTANVILGGEPAVQVPIQVIQSTFGTPPRACLSADQSPASGGFNGILGVGLFPQDCGTGCANSASNGLYYACNGSTCSGAAVSLANQVQNPVALLPQDNNGVLLQLPNVPATGASSVNGSLILGIGTRANNVPSGATTYPASLKGNFTTTFNGSAQSNSFIDSGSNGLFFTDANLPLDSSRTWFVPSPPATLSATNTGAGGFPSGTVSFQIYNANALFGANNVFNDLGGNLGGVGGFDWGLPFFLGRNVFVGFEGARSSLGSGPYWAY